MRKHFKSRVRKFYKSSEPPTQWATAAASALSEEFNLKSIFEKYDAALGDLIDLS